METVTKLKGNEPRTRVKKKMGRGRRRTPEMTCGSKGSQQRGAREVSKKTYVEDRVGEKGEEAREEEVGEEIAR